MKLLIAEDEMEIALQYKMMFEHKGHTVKMTDNGKSCIDEFDKEQAYDCIILDHKMPEKTGIDVAKHILKHNPNQRIIIASAYLNQSIKQQITQLGKITEMITKPFKITDLLKMLEENSTKKFVDKVNANTDSQEKKIEDYQVFLNNHIK